MNTAKTVALMQPYAFPYIGYFQLIHVVDVFISYDDVQWIKGGWINRNRVLVDGEPEYITLPVAKDSMTKYINERFLVDTFDDSKTNILELLAEQYSEAPYYNDAIVVIERCLSFRNLNVADFVTNSLKEICIYLGIHTKIIYSSSLEGKNTEVRSQDRVLDIISKVDAKKYINAIGGRELYSKDIFSQHGIELSFIKTIPIEYGQLGSEFTPNLSIIDVMMFNSVDQITVMLNNYELI